MTDGTIALEPGDRTLIETLLEPNEQVLHAAPAEATMRRAGIVAVAYAVPAFAVGWFPLRKALANVGTLGSQPDGRLFFLLFAGFGLFWIAIALRLLWEPARLHRLYPHMFHLLTDRRFLAIDRRSGPLHAFPLDEIWQMKTFSPFGRLTLRRTGFVTPTGRRAKLRDFDGVRGVETVAQTIADRTGVPVGWGKAAVAASVARMPQERQPR